MTGDRKRVIVLEDSWARIEWIEIVLRRSGAEVFSTSSVQEFLFEAKRPHVLAVFDHDLGVLLPDGTANSIDGTGEDAAKAYQPCGASALVWSANPSGAARIGKILEEKGVQTTVLAFEDRNLAQMAQGLRAFLEDE